MVKNKLALGGRTLLLAEDDYWIAQDMVGQLEAAGAEVIGPVASVKAAIELIDRTEHIDGAILDVNLQGVLAWPIADVLLQRGVRFVFASGYDGSIIPAHYPGVARFQKPVTVNKIVDGLFG